MKYRYSAWPYRLAAFLLAAVCTAVGLLSGVVTIHCVNEGYYFSDKTFQTTWQCAEVVRNEGWTVIKQFRRNENYDKWDKLLEHSNLRFIIMDEQTGDVMASYVNGLNVTVPDNMANNLYLYEYNTNMELGEPGTFLENVYVCDYYFGTDAEGGRWGSYSSNYEQVQLGWDEYDRNYPVTESSVLETEDLETSYQIIYILPRNLNGYHDDPLYQGYRVYSMTKDWSTEAPVIFCVCLVGLLAITVFLMFQAGHRPDTKEIRASWLERIPLDFLLVIGVLAGIGAIAAICAAVECIHNYYITVEELRLILWLLAAGSTVCGVVVLAVLCSCAVHIKQRNFWRSMLVFRFCAWCLRPFKKMIVWLWDRLILGLSSVGIVPRAVLVMLGVILAELLLLTWLVNAWSPEFPLVLLVLFNVFLLLAMIWGFAQMRILQRAAKSLADGNLEKQLDTSKMYWDFKQHGDHLNAIAGGLNKAVEQRMKSERLKTELITNVSHDIKTPLTSIVNYVDLLQKPHTEAEAIQYLEVLDRQAKRLKRLTENLVEASKASTGNMAVDLAPTNVLELVSQAAEEYRDRLEAGKLELVTNLRGDLTVLADGKLMWRILDNLLNNVIKYALPGTRVYLTAQKQEVHVVIAVKNISREPLNVDAEELMERFVRGDSSRHTEGSGLGLNIARSLTQLQNGRFELTVDGDLFKAEVFLPVV